MASYKSCDHHCFAVKKTAVLSAVHLLVDMYCAVVFFAFVSGGSKAWEAMVLYNACAFAGQAPIGAIADRLKNGLAVASIGCLLLAGSWFLRAMPLVFAVIAGLGNGSFHAGAGYSVLWEGGNKARDLGIFVSTGAIGLYCGTADADMFAKFGLVFVMLFTLLAAAGAYFALRGQREYELFSPEERELTLAVPQGGVIALCCLTLVVILRAFIGSTECFKIPDMPGSAAVLCVAGGKALGGFLMDGLGAKKASLLSLLPCAALVLIGAGTATGAVLRLCALLLFNMTMPITLYAAAGILKNARGFAFGLLTFGLFIGYVPVFLGAETAGIPQYAYSLLIFASLALLITGLMKGRVGAAPSLAAEDK